MPNRKPLSLIPHDDKKRLKRLYQYEILNTPVDEEFDKIAQLAADIFDCPGAFITFVDIDSVFFKSNLSQLKENVIPRKDSLCSLSILEDKVTIIEDASQFEDLMESPYIRDPEGIKFYAGAPLITLEGYKLGAICVIDDKPRKATSKQLKILADLSKVVMEMLESRLVTKKMIAVQTEYLNRSVHDLKNYIGNLTLATDLLREAKLEDELKILPEIIIRNLNQLSERVNQMLNLSKIENGGYNLSIEKCDISELLDEVVSNFSTMSKNKNQVITKKYSKEIVIHADSKIMTEIIENLLGNAIKFSFKNSEIIITSKEDAGNVVLGFHDKGQGLTEEDLEKIFIRYAKLSSQPTGKEISSGLGLAITKILVELHHGKIWVESIGKDCGSSFFISFPKKFA